jgi:hypothetical protein
VIDVLEFLGYSIIFIIILPMAVYLLVRVGSSAFFRSFQEFLKNKKGE